MTHATTSPSGSPAGRRDRVRASALWAAWADATGFISELTDAAGLRRRTHSRPLTGPVPWRRRIGGKYGPTLELPAGTYSDDTQLRLATCRALGSNGFDAAAFARVELTVWPSYALGGGRASKAAAHAMTRADAAWYAATYPGWLDSGGNGAVMRIQPHAWAEAHPDRSGPWVTDVLVNAACTHAHPRALLACTLHSYSLGRAVVTGTVPTTDEWPRLLELAADSYSAMSGSPELRDYWLPAWDAQAHQAGRPGFEQTWDETCREVAAGMRALAPLAHQLSEVAGRAAADLDDAHRATLTASYEQMIALLQLREPATLGSGTATTMAALAVASALPGRPEAAVLLACNAVGTDTDTIATMVGALVGAAAAQPPPHYGTDRGDTDRGETDAVPTADLPYQRELADRCYALSRGHDVTPTPYPDLLTWSAPKTQADALGMHAGRRALAGLGPAEPAAPPVVDQRGFPWQWHRLDHGQHVLVKMRPELVQLPSHQMPALAYAATGLVSDRPSSTEAPGPQPRPDPRAARRQAEARRRGALATPVQPALDLTIEPPGADDELPGTGAGSDGDRPGAGVHELADADIDALLTWVGNQRYDERSIGYLVRRLSQSATVPQYLTAMTALRLAMRRSTTEADATDAT